ncbi:MAG: ParA family protein [Bacteroidota bacterium]
MIITVAGFKGGIGKTTTAIHLAAFLRAKAPTLFIDADENRSAYSWGQRSNLAFEVTTDNLAPKVIMKTQPQHMVIDTKARPSSEDLEEIAENCDLVILPTTIRPLDFQALLQTIEKMKILNTPYKVLLTMVPPTSTRQSADIQELLIEQGIPVFKTFVSRYAFVEQLPLDGQLAKSAKDINSKKVWGQYTAIGKELFT